MNVRQLCGFTELIEIKWDFAALKTTFNSRTIINYQPRRENISAKFSAHAALFAMSDCETSNTLQY